MPCVYSKAFAIAASYAHSKGIFIFSYAGIHSKKGLAYAMFRKRTKNVGDHQLISLTSLLFSYI